MSVVPTSSSSSSDNNVHTTGMRVGELPADLPPPNLLGEPDAVSARATVRGREGEGGREGKRRVEGGYTKREGLEVLHVHYIAHYS